MAEHAIRYEIVGRRVQALCTCGWSGPERETHVEAGMDANAHLPLRPKTARGGRRAT